ncbi:hypothetical protein BJ138DRAFT_1117801 [Hygrophoropsis aurantiaca]|uniref:Uncharacterized protein n=1 Tax=Hygrophoropsis aurantiaca TaxID=72124 RepID=A0ACB7ZYG5_9AGAM|nr:hypothetical protein BJ138DRAFT_1117801 [Hygrophoropsis aurantiaca]
MPPSIPEPSSSICKLASMAEMVSLEEINDGEGEDSDNGDGEGIDGDTYGLCACTSQLKRPERRFSLFTRQASPEFRVLLGNSEITNGKPRGRRPPPPKASKKPLIIFLLAVFCAPLRRLGTRAVVEVRRGVLREGDSEVDPPLHSHEYLTVVLMPSLPKYLVTGPGHAEYHDKASPGTSVGGPTFRSRASPSLELEGGRVAVNLDIKCLLGHRTRTRVFALASNSKQLQFFASAWRTTSVVPSNDLAAAVSADAHSYVDSGIAARSKASL